MPTKLVLLSAATLLIIGSSAFEANATMGVGTESLSAQAKSYSPIQAVSCNGQGMFCKAGSSLQCKPMCVCVPCSSPPPVHVKHHKHAG